MYLANWAWIKNIGVFAIAITYAFSVLWQWMGFLKGLLSDPD